MPQLKIPVRHYYVDSDQEKWRIESKFHYIEKTLAIDPKEAALILLDIWREGDNSFSKRAAEITLKRIVPAVNAARKAGIIIVHAPSPNIAKRYPQWTKFAGDEEVNPSKPSPPEWPPQEFVERKGKYSEYSRKIYRGPQYLDSLIGFRDIADPVKPLPEDLVVTTGNHLHRLLKAQKILHIFYAGFYVNMCIQYRDYGMRAMGMERGYNVVLLRDCTTAIESHDTVDELLMTKASIQHIETLLGFTATSEDFIRACENLT